MYVLSNGDASLLNSNALYKWIILRQSKFGQIETDAGLRSDFKKYAAQLIIRRSLTLNSTITSRLLDILLAAIKWRYKVNTLLSFVFEIMPHPEHDAEKFLRFVQYFWWRIYSNEKPQFPFQ